MSSQKFSRIRLRDNWITDEFYFDEISFQADHHWKSRLVPLVHGVMTRDYQRICFYHKTGQVQFQDFVSCTATPFYFILHVINYTWKSISLVVVWLVPSRVWRLKGPLSAYLNTSKIQKRSELVWKWFVIWSLIGIYFSLLTNFPRRNGKLCQKINAELLLYLRKQVFSQLLLCTFSRSVHNSHMFLNFYQGEGSVLGSSLGPFVPQSHALLTAISGGESYFYLK